MRPQVDLQERTTHHIVEHQLHAEDSLLQFEPAHRVPDGLVAGIPLRLGEDSGELPELRAKWCVVRQQATHRAHTLAQFEGTV